MRRWIDLRAAAASGLIVGTLFCVLELLLPRLLLSESVWTPLRAVAAAILGRQVAPEPTGHTLGAFAIAITLHLGLSVFYACLGSLAFHRVAHGPAMLLGLMFGFVLYIINFYVFASWFAWFQADRGLLPITLHVLFGVFTALSYHL